ncbi:hypothetical protein CK203_044956 [Vitis vinifera]|uniref:Disease resistance R13L4/SHOC-2-like LRR domain-containing protein n=1 Tax=Vitis vinifera TaxID=29760 RepID=A0A438HFJ3_VITVI|nr:hypothetical protein CK203_044956 [Vitis vinifera]
MNVLSWRLIMEKDLRTLELANNSIEELPREIAQLIHLSKCWRLENLPQGLGKLINLRHLKTDSTLIRVLPKGIGRLSSLRTLAEIAVVGDDDDDNSLKVGDLPNLNNLCGHLAISGLGMEKVESKRRIPCCNNAMFPFIDTGEMPQARGPAGQLAPDDAAADFVHLRFSCYDFEEINTDLWVKKSPATTKPTAMAGYCLITAIPEAVLATNHWRRRPSPPWIIRHRPTRRLSSPTVVFLNVSYSSMEKPEIYRALHKQ